MKQTLAACKTSRFCYCLGANCIKAVGSGQRSNFPAKGNPGGSVDLSVLRQSDVQVLRLRGRLTLGDPVDAFKNALEQSIASGDTQILVNLAEVPLMDSSGIGVLVRSQTSARQQGGSIKLVQPTAYTIKTLKMVGLLDLFEVYDSEAEAAAAFE
jgi:anti-anti-sigma factor